MDDDKNISLIKEYYRFFVNWGRCFSIGTYLMGSGCCAQEMESIFNPSYDAERLGIYHVSSPRHADLLVVGGPINEKMAREIVETYSEIGMPKWVLANGACSCGGGLFNKDGNLKKLHDLIKVDIFIPGCPPRPEALIYSILRLRLKIRMTSH